MNDNYAPIQPPSTMRRVPVSDTDYLNSVTEPHWRDREKNLALDRRALRPKKDKNGNVITVTDEQGNERVLGESYLEAYEMFTQDIRLGNLDPLEIPFVREHLDVSHDLFNQGYTRSAVVALERAINIIETSHSKKGWLRNRMNTISTESKHEQLEPRKGFFGGKRD